MQYMKCCLKVCQVPAAERCKNHNLFQEKNEEVHGYCLHFDFCNIEFLEIRIRFVMEYEKIHKGVRKEPSLKLFSILKCNNFRHIQNSSPYSKNKDG